MAANTVTFRLVRDEEVYEDFEVEKPAAMESQVVKNFIEKDTGMEPLRFPIPYHNIKSGKVLEMVLDYCKFHAHARSFTIPDDDVKIWDNEFAEKALSADKNQAGADFLNHKSVEELRLIFKIENDFSEQEEEAIMQETKWTYA
ncbi:SKP1-like protein 11 [Cryptomeria japonica]|uniref:SKP1-like protein 11 n=1 Tax=Cryptomeria japonica TaxID=3369 RepID=UPI0027D9E13C|nr:SKP1-like protein 11 [Cryptomeria japonica]